MLPMLLGAYGRRREVDKAWALYQALQGGGGQPSPAPADAAAEGADGAAAGAGDAAAAAGPGRPAETAQQAAQQREQAQRAWEERLAERQRQLAAWAAGLVRDLRLAERPLGPYGYSAVLTALSRVGGCAWLGCALWAVG